MKASFLTLVSLHLDEEGRMKIHRRQRECGYKHKPILTDPPEQTPKRTVVQWCRYCGAVHTSRPHTPEALLDD